MENKSNFMLHPKRNTPLDAYELYELEHMPRTIGNATTFESPSVHANSHAPHDRGGVKPGAGKGKKGRCFWNTTRKYNNVEIYDEKNIDAEAEKFIEFEHGKFELISKWMPID